jgi:translation elongation factor EF-1beta
MTNLKFDLIQIEKIKFYLRVKNNIGFILNKIKLCVLIEKEEGE